MEQAKARLRKEMDNVLSSVYTDCGHFIESDAWTNYRNVLRDELETELVEGDEIKSGWYGRVRKRIFEENRDNLIAALDQDNLREIELLKIRLENAERRHW